MGDSGPASLSWLSWLSPLGWVEFTRSFGSAGERWWVLTLPLVVSVALVAAAFALAAWRDQGAGLLPDRPGRPASGLLRGPFGLAWRVQRLMLAAWPTAFVLAFAAPGAGTRGVGSILGGSAVLKRYLLRTGYQATVINAYLSELMMLAGLAAAAFAISAVLRLRTEETGNLADPVLAAATGRIRSHRCNPARPHRRARPPSRGRSPWPVERGADSRFPPASQVVDPQPANAVTDTPSSPRWRLGAVDLMRRAHRAGRTGGCQSFPRLRPPAA